MMPPVQPETIMRHVYGLFPGLALLAGIRLDIFSLLEEGSKNAGLLAEVLKVKERRLAPLLQALVVSGMLALEHGRFSNTPESGKYLGKSLYRDHIRHLIEKILNAVPMTDQTIRLDAPQAAVDWTGLTSEQEISLFSGQYHGSIHAGETLGRMLEFSPADTIMDGAGGTGGLAIGLCRTRTDLRITVADLPAVLGKTRKRIAAAGLADRISLMEADLVNHPPPGRFDTVVLRSFIQVLSPADAQRALNHIRLAMRPGGRLCIIGHFLENSGLYPVNTVFHNLVFLNLYEGGRAYTADEYRTWLESAGFGDLVFQYDVFPDGAGMVLAYLS